MSTPASRSFIASHEAFRSGTDTPRDFLERCLDSPRHGKTRFTPSSAPISTRRDRPPTNPALAGRPRAALSPIDGMPVGIKDIIETADMPTEQGSPLFNGWRSVRDSAGVAALREAGAVILGKTVTTEFAAVDPGPTRNPWDTSRTPGGSSSGSAAAVAVGIVSAALGTQVIGSIVRPASYLRLLRLQAQPRLDQSRREFRLSEPRLRRRARRDLAGTLDRGPRDIRPSWRRSGLCRTFGPRDDSGRSPAKVSRRFANRGLRFAEPGSGAGFRGLQGKAGEARHRAAHHDNSSTVDAVEDAIADAGALSRKINAWESRWPFNTYARNLGSEGLSQTMRDRLREAEAMTLESYQALLAERARCRETYDKLQSLADACITMSASGPAPVGIASTGDPTFAIAGSLLGVPALSLPLFTVSGLPVGLQVLGFRDRDAKLFEIAAFLQTMS